MCTATTHLTPMPSYQARGTSGILSRYSARMRIHSRVAVGPYSKIFWASDDIGRCLWWSVVFTPACPWTVLILHADGEACQASLSEKGLLGPAVLEGQCTSYGDIPSLSASGEGGIRKNEEPRSGLNCFAGRRSTDSESNTAAPADLADSYAGLEPPDVLVLQPPRLGCDKVTEALTVLFLHRTSPLYPGCVSAAVYPPAHRHQLRETTRASWEKEALM